MRLEAAPVQRHWLRMLAGVNYYRLKRWLRWHNGHSTWASATVSPAEMPHRLVSHQTPLRRQLRNVDMWLQENKIANLRLALRRLDGLRLAPGETLSFWRQVGNPIALRGFKVGMALHNGRIRPEVGGGLCQLSNLIYWMTIHTPLTVTERWRHNYDVFPDADRILPFGSGATCFYNYIDLQIANRTEQQYSLHLALTESDLTGEWRSDHPCPYRYQVYEASHAIRQEFWGGYSRHNSLRRRVLSPEGDQIDDQFVVENHAIMVYQPLLPSG